MGDKRIPISEANRDALTELKRGDDTYDDVIERLLDGGAVSECDCDADSIAETVAGRLEGSKPLEDMAFDDWWKPNHAQTIALSVVDELEGVDIAWGAPNAVSLEASERRKIAQEVAEELQR